MQRGSDGIHRLRCEDRRSNQRRLRASPSASVGGHLCRMWGCGGKGMAPACPHARLRVTWKGQGVAGSGWRASGCGASGKARCRVRCVGSKPDVGFPCAWLWRGAVLASEAGWPAAQVSGQPGGSAHPAAPHTWGGRWCWQCRETDAGLDPMEGRRWVCEPVRPAEGRVCRGDQQEEARPGGGSLSGS